MGKPEKPSANPFWDFSLRVYARPGVAQEALRLQDAAGQDVNLLLFCCWAGACGHELSAEEAHRLEAVSAGWREAVVRQLRAVRRYLKPLEGEDGISALRAAVKRQELEAERLQQDRLNAALPLSGSGDWNGGAAAQAERNLQVFFEATGQDAPAVSSFLAAAFAESE